MNAPSLLACLKAVGVRVALEDDSLSLDAPHGVLTDTLLNSIKTLKPELLSLLSTAPDESPCGTLSAQSTADPEPPPREGATWDATLCVWRWRHWIMRTPRSIELERALLQIESAAPEAPCGILAAQSTAEAAGSFSPRSTYDPALATARARRQFNDGLIDAAQRDALISYAHTAWLEAQAPGTLNVLENTKKGDDNVYSSR